ncbi:MAG: peptidoglycan glycosyltransferase [Lachnospiraceae bacterium]|nr:peptidoglycan glycosyltransferase [Lachnospiraceae bacterium]MDY2620089.1 penicillin-binding transpeptidase domain-containing protein [Agathobacter sp.]
MQWNKTYHRKKICVFFFCVLACAVILLGRLVYLMIFRGDYYSKLATDLQQRERQIKAARGKILDRNGVVLAGNKSVCTISVIHNQIEEPEKVIQMLCKELGISEEKVRKRVEKRSSIERIKSNVDKETGNRILAYGFAGVKVDEDYKREYPFDELGSKVLGFTGGDNQGIIGLETVYDEELQGTDGTILTTTDARGVEVDNIGEERVEPIAGNNLRLTLDANIQKFAEQAAQKAFIQKEADSVSILVMNPQNGEMLAMVDYPEFNLNEPFTLTETYADKGNDEQDALNQMWRNHCINDTYEPGSTFKIITASAALEEHVVSLEDRFHCPGYIVVEDRRIRCHKTTGHGAESFVEGIENSCNPVFINVGLRIGADRFYDYFEQFGLLQKTNIDLPGEAATIMHKREDIGLVELATVSFGQSFQITPIQLATTVSSIINGGNRVTPHFGMQVEKEDSTCVRKMEYEPQTGICSPDTSEKMRFLLEKVVSEGGGNKAYIEGYSIGGKTATSQTLPRSANKYISSFLGFAPADDPQVLVLVIIRNPSGVYYGGTIAAPVAKEIFENILPYLELQ